jgi:alkylation response protein AidB-like acyl-CoA dehydrogenase
MADPAKRHATEAEARAIAEASREKKWDKPSFMREMFLGNLRMDWIYPFPNYDLPERPEYAEFTARMKDYLLNEIDPLEIDATGEFPSNIVERLSELGALGMNLPKEYGGQGFSKAEYCRTMVMSSGYEGSLMGFLSPHQSVGVPECLKLFGTKEQKEKYLPLCASGHVSAFALTELDVGSDPARVSTSLEETPDGQAYLLNGTKLWCTNGTMAKLLVVMARHKETGKISAVVVETAWEGVKVDHRCRFMGLSALANAVLSFTNVRVPKENMIAREGAGLRIALTALNTGRLSIPYGAVGGAKKALEVARTWARERVQWGKPIGQHEAIAHKLSHMAGKVLAMESIAEFACQLADVGKYDIRLEAAAAKEFNTCRAWEIIDDTMQIRGGRGYEKETSLLARGERAMPVERLMRDGRVSKIFEGASEIMHLLMARDAVDKHLSVAGDLIDSKVPMGKKLSALPKVLGFYATWYPSRYIGVKGWFGYSEFGSLAPHVRFVERSARKLARQAFHAMVVYGPKLERKQAFLFRWVDIAMELFAISVVASRVQTMKDHQAPEAESAAELADVFCRNARRRVTQLFGELWHNDDDLNYEAAQAVMDERYAWLESGILTMEEVDAARARRQAGATATSVEELLEAAHR